MARSPVYLEKDCPIGELSVESQRERGASSALPPLYFLHVWWARRPLTVSRASVLGSLLPDTVTRTEFLELMGVPRSADPIGERDRIAEANRAGRKLDEGFSYKRAFSVEVSKSALERMRKLLREKWGTEQPVVLDSFAGGGSIPFEAHRMGFNVILNELNPVACVIERATISYPGKFGPKLAEEIENWGQRISQRVKIELGACFPKKPGEDIFVYIWTRTIECPQCQLQIPLAPNWWLDKPGKIGYKMVVPGPPLNQCSFVISPQSASFDPDAGSVTRGVANCPRCTRVVDGELIKSEAQAGRLGHQLAAIGFKVEGKTGRFFRPPNEQDLKAVELATSMLAERMPQFEQQGLVPSETRYIGPADRSATYGIRSMTDLYSPRQLLVHLSTLQALLDQPWTEVKDPARREALRVYSALALDKCLNYNAVLSNMNTRTVRMAPVFDRHDFAFSWSYGEIDGSGPLQGFAWGNTAVAYKGLANTPMLGSSAPITFRQGDAGNLQGIQAGSVHVVSMDPPYYDNVMYAELADFFYVWMKRSLGDVFPALFTAELTDKDSEAVANVARFKTGRRGAARQLADDDYTAKMLAAFRECHRVLRDDGVLTIMFTHKKVDAWDSLGRALMDSGFEISATWPVHTEAEHSLHQAKKNAAASTILLVCRKRQSTESAWWNEIEQELKSTVRERAQKFHEMGLKGQDTSIACFGPALQVISRKWPVKRKDGSTIKPDEALDIAREEVSDWFFELIAEGKAEEVDKWTRFYVLAWYIFGAREFPYDEARKLALSVKVDIDKELIPRGLLDKKSNSVVLSKPEDRFRKGKLDPTAKSYNWDVDYVQAAVHAYEQGQSTELNRFHQRTEALQRPGYLNAIKYLLEGVLPRTAEVTEYHALDKLWEANLQDRLQRKKPRTSDPTFEKQRRLGQFEGTGQTKLGGSSESSGEAESDEEDEES